ncbi:MAG: hypothetical protein ABWW69_01130 [Pyrodictiaceae archaeon]
MSPNILVRLMECRSAYNPVFVIEENGLRYFYGIPSLELLEQQAIDHIIVPVPLMDAALMLRRIALTTSPEKITVTISSSSPLRNTVNVLGFKVNEYFYEASLSKLLSLMWSTCGSTLVSKEKRLIITPPCEADQLVEAVERLVVDLYRPRIIASPIGPSSDLYLKRLQFYDPEVLAVPECVAQNRLVLETLGIEILRQGAGYRL